MSRKSLAARSGNAWISSILGVALAVIVALGCSDERVPPMESGASLDFASLRGEHPRLADERIVSARDGAALRVRTYGTTAPVDLILLHGSGAFNVYLSDLAAAIADSGVAVVHTPDLRGHGAAPERRGDIDYIDQLEDDLADLIRELAAEHPQRKRVIGGHSSGGGLAIRFAGGPHAEEANGYLLFAPFLQHDAPTTRPDSGGWASPRLGPIIGLTMLNALGIRALNGTTVLEFDLPVERRSGRETPAYTFRMMTGINPRDYRTDLAALRVPTLVIVGSDDEAFIAERFPEVFAAHAPEADVAIVPRAGHLGLVTNAEATKLSIDWLRGFATGQTAGPDA
jgi:non-heme chloroperoxidase